MLIVEVYIIHLKILETFFTALAYVFGGPLDYKCPVLRGNSKLRADEHFRAEFWILEQ
jgi:hypothetical protein